MSVVSSPINPAYPGKASGEYRNGKAFAATYGDGSVVTWGDVASGGDSTAVASKLNGDIDVIQVFSNSSAFAALLADGALVTWGSASAGGDSSAVAAQINGSIDVTRVFSSSSAFAALRADGSVVTWGNATSGGNSSSVASQLNGAIDVTQIFSTSSAFAALRSDGSVVTWGLASFGGDSSTVASKLDGTTDVTTIYSTSGAFAALRADGSVTTWGSISYGGDSSTVANLLDGSNDVTRIFSNLYAFAALRADGSLVTWGSASAGGNSSAVAASLDGSIDVTQVFASNNAFAALLADGSVKTWGSASAGGDSLALASKLDGSVDIVEIAATSSAFAALRADGSVITWGHGWYGGDSSSVAGKLDGTVDVKKIYANSGAFAALRADGSVVTWGDPAYGGNSSSVADQISGVIDVVDIFSSGFAFAALRVDGSVAIWGSDLPASNPFNNGQAVVAIASPFQDDRLVTLPTVIGTGGNDLISGTSGNDIVDGGAGTDTLNHQQRHAAYEIKANATGAIVDGPEGRDTLIGIERLAFADASLAFEIEGTAGQIYRLYKSAFARSPDPGGLGSWIGGMDNGLTLEQVAAAFIGSDEFKSLYTANPSASKFVELLYLNVLGRAPDSGGLNHWVYQIESGIQTRAQVLVLFSESPENKNAVLPRIKDGILYAASPEQAQIAAQGLILDGTAGDDTIFGSIGKDIIAGLGGNDVIDGGAGVDTALYQGARSAYAITVGSNGLNVSSAHEGNDNLVNIERLKFTDKILAFDIDGNAGQVYRLYQAAFNRTPDTAGLSDWIRGADQGMTLQNIAKAFIASQEFQILYGANPSNDAFVTALYLNAIGRAPDEGGKAYWVEQLNNGLSKELALIGFSESVENQAIVIGAIQNGIELSLG